MNCSDWEERLALYAGGDLAPDQASEVESHLAECAGCQLFASGLRGALELLEEAHQEAPGAGHFTAVRSRVLAQIERERRPFWRRAWVYGLAAAAVAILVAVTLRSARWVAPEPPQVALAHPAAPRVVAANRPVTVAARRHVVRKPHPRTVAPEPVLVRLVTDDPDVVIYWISERRGDY